MYVMSEKNWLCFKNKYSHMNVTLWNLQTSVFTIIYILFQNALSPLWKDMLYLHCEKNLQFNVTLSSYSYFLKGEFWFRLNKISNRFYCKSISNILPRLRICCHYLFFFSIPSRKFKFYMNTALLNLFDMANRSRLAYGFLYTIYRWLLANLHILFGTFHHK